MRKEKWKDIKGWKGFYQVSNYGRVKSVARTINCSDGKTQTFKERILTQFKVGSKKKIKYLGIKLQKNRKVKNARVHTLVGTHFIPNPNKHFQLNHKDGNKENNHDWNLEWTNNRENCTHHQNKKKKSSKYIGVMRDKARQKWISRIRIKSKSIHLGRYAIEKEAADAYQQALKKYKLKNKYATF